MARLAAALAHMADSPRQMPDMHGSLCGTQVIIIRSIFPVRRIPAIQPEQQVLPHKYKMPEVIHSPQHVYIKVRFKNRVMVKLPVLRYLVFIRIAHVHVRMLSAELHKAVKRIRLKRIRRG